MNKIIDDFSNLNAEKIIKFGKWNFLLGVFFLPTAVPISILLFLIALLASAINFKESLNDRWNLPIFFCIFFIVITSLVNSFLNNQTDFVNLTSNNLLLNLFNWIPTLLFFIASQTYLKKGKDREIFCKFLISGTIPVMLSCLFQQWFNVVGPFETLNGLIVWYQKSISETGGVTGLFSNRNYSGIWLSINLPFSFFLMRNSEKRISKIFILGLIIVLIYLICFVNSKNAFISMLISILIFFGLKTTLFIFSILFSLLLLFKLISFLIPEESFTIKRLLSNSIIDRIVNQSFNFNSPRISTWKSALFFILERPLFGWGAGAFATLYLSSINPFRFVDLSYKAQHTHNLTLELAINFGLPVAIIITVLAFTLFFKSYLIINDTRRLNKYYSLDKAWIASIAVVLISHATDITFFDGKISLLICILFAGLRCILLQENINKKLLVQEI